MQAVSRDRRPTTSTFVSRNTPVSALPMDYSPRSIAFFNMAGNKLVIRFALVVAICLMSGFTIAAEKGDLPPGIFEYAERAEPAYKWDVVGTRKLPQGVVHHLHLV